MNLEDGRVVSNFLRQGIKNEAISVYGDGQQTRSFCYVSDMVEGLLRLFEAKDDITGPINLGNPNEFTMLELAKLVQRITESKGKIEFQELPMDDPKQRKPSIEKAKQLLSWSPLINLENGLEEMMYDFKMRINGSETK
jgi:UDP-glucuronate decarboxylase